MNGVLNDLQRMNQAKADIIAALEEKGVHAPEGARISDIPALVESIIGGNTMEDIALRMTNFSDFEDGVIRDGVLDSATRSIIA